MSTANSQTTGSIISRKRLAIAGVVAMVVVILASQVHSSTLVGAVMIATVIAASVAVRLDPRVPLAMGVLMLCLSGALRLGSVIEASRYAGSWAAGLLVMGAVLVVSRQRLSLPSVPALPTTAVMDWVRRSSKVLVLPLLVVTVAAVLVLAVVALLTGPPVATGITVAIAIGLFTWRFGSLDGRLLIRCGLASLVVVLLASVVSQESVEDRFSIVGLVLTAGGVAVMLFRSLSAPNQR